MDLPLNRATDASYSKDMRCSRYSSGDNLGSVVSSLTAACEERTFCFWILNALNLAGYTSNLVDLVGTRENRFAGEDSLLVDQVSIHDEGRAVAFEITPTFWIGIWMAWEYRSCEREEPEMLHRCFEVR